jgi:hypothetical protein
LFSDTEKEKVFGGKKEKKEKMLFATFHSGKWQRMTKRVDARFQLQPR